MLKRQDIKIAAQPIIWSNDDFHDLGGNIPLEQCLTEMREAGYSGTELGHKFPKDPVLLKPILKKYDLQLVSGWHSTYLAQRDFNSEKEDYQKHLNFLREMGSSVVIVAECSRRVYNDPSQPLGWNYVQELFSEDQWKKITSSLDAFAVMAEDAGLKLVYHHHMGTGIQGLKQIDRLMDQTKKVWLLGDTGHLAFAGENPVSVFKKYGPRIKHVHLKNVRHEVVKKARNEKYSFEKAVREGVFTVPGDGGIDFGLIFEVLKAQNYSGWMVVEAEQDPVKAPPFQYAKRARRYVYDVAGV